MLELSQGVIYAEIDLVSGQFVIGYFFVRINFCFFIKFSNYWDLGNDNGQLDNKEFLYCVLVRRNIVCMNMKSYL